MLVTPFNKFKAYELGIIDEKGKVLRKFKEVKGSEKNTIQCFIDLYLI